MNNLSGKTVAILVAHGFEQNELVQPRQALVEAGAMTQIVSPERGAVRCWNNQAFGEWFDIDVPLNEAREEEYDALLLPGGVMNPDKLRQLPKAVKFVRSFFAAGKPVAAICHGPQLLIDADVLQDRKVTSYPSLKKDLINAGATWLDREVVVDQGLVTSRTPEDIPAFNKKVIEEIGEGVHAGQGR